MQSIFSAAIFLIENIKLKPLSTSRGHLYRHKTLNYNIALTYSVCRCSIFGSPLKTYSSNQLYRSFWCFKRRRSENISPN